MPPLLPFVREPTWLDAGRARAWGRILVVLCGSVCLALVALTRGGARPDPWGRPLGTDFASFWTAAVLALNGTAASAWNPVVHGLAQRDTFAAASGFAPDYYAFFYPPPFLLLLMPLGLLPYAGAVCAWAAVTTAAAVAAVCALLRERWAALACAAYTAFALNAADGQNGALSTALLGAAALCLERRPRIAGLCLGALCYKPQLAVLVLPALLAGPRRRALAWAAIMAGGMCLASALALSPGAWPGFWRAAPLAQAAMTEGWVGFAKMVTPFAGLRLLGASVTQAAAGQAAASGAAMWIVWQVARRKSGGRADIAVLTTAACLGTPFLLDYDLLVLAIPLAWLAAEALRTGWRPWEKSAAAAAFLLPLLARPVALHTGIPLSPLVVALLLLVVSRRAGVTVPAGSPKAPSVRRGCAGTSTPR